LGVAVLRDSWVGRLRLGKWWEAQVKVLAKQTYNYPLYLLLLFLFLFLLLQSKLL
jgi:hypothetical protein